AAAAGEAGALGGGGAGRAQPGGLGPVVGVEDDDELPARLAQAGVAGGREAAVGAPHVAQVGGVVVLDDSGGVVGRAVVDHHHLEVRRLLRQHRPQGSAQARRPVVGAHDHTELHVPPPPAVGSCPAGATVAGGRPRWVVDEGSRHRPRRSANVPAARRAEGASAGTGGGRCGDRDRTGGARARGGWWPSRRRRAWSSGRRRSRRRRRARPRSSTSGTATSSTSAPPATRSSGPTCSGGSPTPTVTSSR